MGMLYSVINRDDLGWNVLQFDKTRTAATIAAVASLIKDPRECVAALENEHVRPLTTGEQSELDAETHRLRERRNAG